MIDPSDNATADLFGHGCGTCFQVNADNANRINERILEERLVRIPPSPPSHTIEPAENQQLNLAGVAFESLSACQK